MHRVVLCLPRGSRERMLLFVGELLAIQHTYVVRVVLRMEMGRLTRDGTAEPVSRDRILRRERGQGNIHFSCLADHEQDWQPYLVDPYPCYM